MILHPKKGGRSLFSHVFDQPPPHTHLPKPRKIGFQVGVAFEGGGGLDQKSMGDAFIAQNNDYTRVKKTIQPVEVGHANSPQKDQKGRYVAYSPIYRPAWPLNTNLCDVIFEQYRLKSCIRRLCTNLV